MLHYQTVAKLEENTCNVLLTEKRLNINIVFGNMGTPR